MNVGTKFFRIAAFSLVLIFFAGCERSWTGDIRGIVSDSESEEGLEGFIVRARSMKNGYAVSTLTDSAGEYRLTDARWGPNLVQIYHPRYTSIEKFADVIRDETVELDFTTRASRIYADPVLSVRIVSNLGEPVNQAVADLYQKKKTVYEYFYLLETRTTGEDGSLEFQLPRMYEDEIMVLQLRVVALNYHDVIKDFVVLWGEDRPSIMIVMNTI